MYDARRALLSGLLGSITLCTVAIGSISVLCGIAYAQGQSDSRTEEAKTMYRSEYPEAKADSRNSFTIQTDRHLYKPGEEVFVQGSIWSSLLSQLGDGVDIVNVRVTDSKEADIADEEAEFDENVGYSASINLPMDAELGVYTLYAKIGVAPGVLDSLQANVTARLETSAKFEVVSPTAFAVKAEGKIFNVTVASNSSSVTDFAFSQAEKTVSFRVEGETGTNGVAQVTLPKELLQGRLTVSIDGIIVAEDLNQIIVTSDNATQMSLEINYPHSQRTIEITGTSVVPEFPVSLFVVIVSIGFIVAVSAATNRWKVWC